MGTVKNTMLNEEGSFTSKVDGLKHGYITSVPLDYDGKKPYDLLVFLHGAGEKPNTGDIDLAKLKVNGPHKEIYSKKRSFQAIITSIQMEKWGAEHKPAVVKEHIDNICKQYNVDRSRIHLTGLSQGGADAYKTAATYPEVFASISVFSGYTGSMAQMSLIKIPTYIRHNSGDLQVGVTNANNAKKWIDAAKPSEAVNLLVYNTSGHNAWSTPYGSEELYTWHFSKSRKLSDNAVKVPVGSPAEVKVEQPVQAFKLVSTTPTPGAVISIPKDKNLGVDLVFSEPVIRGVGKISVNDFGAMVSWPMVRLSGSKVSVYPVPVAVGIYNVTIPAGAFLSETGERSTAITFQFTVK